MLLEFGELISIKGMRKCNFEENAIVRSDGEYIQSLEVAHARHTGDNVRTSQARRKRSPG